MNERPKSPSEILRDVLGRAKTPSQIMEEREGKNSPLAGFLGKNVIDLTKRPK
jgi:hypothetical protein